MLHFMIFLQAIIASLLAILFNPIIYFSRLFLRFKVLQVENPAASREVNYMYR